MLYSNNSSYSGKLIPVIECELASFLQLLINLLRAGYVTSDKLSLILNKYTNAQSSVSLLIPPPANFYANYSKLSNFNESVPANTYPTINFIFLSFYLLYTYKPSQFIFKF